jgi:molybdenum cofactor cytidylyltransferase
MSTVGLLLLAAGSSSRLGRSKQLLRWEGQSLLRRAAEAAVGSGCGPVVVVLGAQAEAHRSELEGLPVQAVLNPHWEQGMGSSLRRGMEAVGQVAGVEAVVVAVCDQPHVRAEHLAALVQAWRTQGLPIVASEYAGTVGVPALFHRSLFAELVALPAQAGAKVVLQREPSRVAVLPLPEAAVDVDTPEDAERLSRGRSAPP